MSTLMPISTVSLFTEGTLVAGRYELSEKIGVGQLGEVYRAKDCLLGGEVCLKALFPAYSSAPAVREALVNDFQTARGVAHSNTVCLYDIFEAEQQLLCLTMELVSGVPLAERTRAGGLDRTALQLFLFEICRGAAAVHKQGAIHGSLRPDHVLIGQNDNVKLTNHVFAQPLQLRKVLHEPENGSAIAYYLAPEQFAQPSTDPRTDVYALGIIAFEMAIGEPPFTGATAAEIGFIHQSAPCPPLSDLRTDCPHWLEEFVLTCTAKDPEQRFPSLENAAAWLIERLEPPAKERLEKTITVVTHSEAIRLRPRTARFLPQILAAAFLGMLLLLAFRALGPQPTVQKQPPEPAASAAPPAEAGRGSTGVTPLMKAAQNGDVQAVKALLSEAAPINAQDKTGMNALIYAAQRGHVAVVEALLAAGAKTAATDAEGRTALLHAVSGSMLDISAALLKGGADPNVQDNNGETALFYAVKNGHHELVQLLLDNKARIQVHDKQGNTPFFYAHGRMLALLQGEAAAQGAAIPTTRGAPPAASPKPTAVLQLTRLRSGTAEGIWRYTPGMTLLKAVKVTVHNTGDAAARGVKAWAVLSDGREVALKGPESLRPNGKAQYSAAELSLQIPGRGKLESRVDCANCYK